MIYLTYSDLVNPRKMVTSTKQSGASLVVFLLLTFLFYFSCTHLPGNYLSIYLPICPSIYSYIYLHLALSPPLSLSRTCAHTHTHTYMIQNLSFCVFCALLYIILNIYYHYIPHNKHILKLTMHFRIQCFSVSFRKLSISQVLFGVHG